MSFNPVLIVAKTSKPEWYKATDPFARGHGPTAVRQLLATIVPYLLLMGLMVQSVRHGYHYGITLALGVVATALFIRIFIFFHDCTHGSFLPSPRWNRALGYLCGILTFTAFHDWRRSHAGHHLSAGDLDRRGMGDITLMTVTEYQEATPLQRLGYRLYRHPLVLLGIGPLYYFLLRNRYPSLGAKRLDFISVIATDLALVVIVITANLTVGLGTYLLVQLPVLAMEGSSFYRLPKLLQWITGNIGFHHIHHLRPGIPNYRLQECYEAIPELQAVKPLTLRKSLGSLRLNLYDEQQRRLVSFRSLSRQ